MDLIKAVAKNMRKYRKGMSLKTISKKSGIPTTTVEQLYYKCKKDVKLSTIYKIAKALGVKVDDLVR